MEASGPWFARRGGADHLLVMTNDKGATFIRGSVPKLSKVNLITQWGWVRPHIHHRDSDVVVPPMLKVDKLIAESPFMSSEQDTREWLKVSSSGYQYLLSFVGSVRFHTPGYSMGVRQAVWRQRLWAEPDMRIVSAGIPDYLTAVPRARFCLHTEGNG